MSLPDLATVPRDRWREVLLPLSEPSRRIALAGAPGNPDEHLRLLGELSLEPRPRAPAPSLPTPTPPEVRRRPFQVNVRLDPHELQLVSEAADMMGLSRAQLARAFLLDGSAALLRRREASG